MTPAGVELSGMPWGFAAAAVGSIASAGIGAVSAGNAASTEANAANAASQAELGMFNKQQADLAPWMTAGGNGLTALQQALGVGANGQTGAGNPIMGMLGLGANGQPTGGGINPSTFQASPGYTFQMQQGLNGVTNSAAANGGLGGNALKALQNYGQGQANQSWNQYLSQVNGGYQQNIGNLQALSGQGLSAASGAGNGALATGGQIGSNLMAAGGALGQGTMAGANAVAGGLNGVGNNALLYAMMNQQQAGGGGSSNGVGSSLSANDYLLSQGFPSNPTSGANYAASTNMGLGPIY